jgi:hypothetical protein
MSTAASLITFDDFLEIPDTEGEKLELVEYFTDNVTI